jgi:hypothetical protein
MESYQRTVSSSSIIKHTLFSCSLIHPQFFPTRSLSFSNILECFNRSSFVKMVKKVAKIESVVMYNEDDQRKNYNSAILTVQTINDAVKASVSSRLVFLFPRRLLHKASSNQQQPPSFFSQLNKALRRHFGLHARYGANSPSNNECF